jgi:hypothetical protein
MILDHAAIRFQQRWKELLDCITPLGTVTVEMTMGIPQVYFPSEARWRRDAPAGLADHWEVMAAACQRWCAQQKLPLTIDDNAWME